MIISEVGESYKKNSLESRGESNSSEIIFSKSGFNGYELFITKYYRSLNEPNPIIKRSKGFCLKLQIYMNTEPIGFSILYKLHIGPVMVFGYFISIIKFRVVLLFYPPDARVHSGIKLPF